VSQMLPEDLMAALGGGGAPAGGGEAGFTPAPAGMGPEAGGLPPDMMGAVGPAPEEGGAPLPTQGAPGGGEQALEQAIALLDEAIMAEADQEDQQVMRQCSAKLQQVLAKNQAEADAGLKGQVSPKAMRKQAAAAGI
jgi:hypothetical protein